MKFLRGKKTFVTGGLSILGALAAYFTGEATVIDAVNIIVPSVLSMTVRHGIATQ